MLWATCWVPVLLVWRNVSCPVLLAQLLIQAFAPHAFQVIPTTSKPLKIVNLTQPATTMVAAPTVHLDSPCRLLTMKLLVSNVLLDVPDAIRTMRTNVWLALLDLTSMELPVLLALQTATCVRHLPCATCVFQDLWLNKQPLSKAQMLLDHLQWWAHIP